MQALVGIRIPQVRPALWRVIFGKDTMPVCIEDDECIDGVQCQIHRVGFRTRDTLFLSRFCRGSQGGKRQVVVDGDKER